MIEAYKDAYSHYLLTKKHQYWGFDFAFYYFELPKLQPDENYDKIRNTLKKYLPKSKS